jgi:hypothetical protein
MKKTAFLGVAAAAFMMAGAAHAQGGYVGLSYQSTDAGGPDDLTSTAISGATLLGEHVQIDGRYASLDAGGSSTGDYWNINGHLFSRSESGLFGAFAGYNSLDEGGSLNEWSAGIEGQFYMNRTTFTGQLGYSDTEGDVKVTHLDAEARHFVSDNFSIQGNLGGGNIEISGSDGDYLSYGVGAEVQFSGAPVSIYGGYQVFDGDGDSLNTIGVGVRYNFGGASLFERNRSGASLVRSTPTFFEALLGGITPR